MDKYRTHHCNELRLKDVGKRVKLSGWVHRRRNHGNLVFIDLRNHFGISQLVFTDQAPNLMDALPTSLSLNNYYEPFLGGGALFLN